MTGYAIFNINVNNPENYKEYVQKVKPTAEKYGGEYLVRGGNNVTVEGCLLYTSPSPRDRQKSRMPSSA